jgi:glucan 1,3-beta-glucosidase
MKFSLSTVVSAIMIGAVCGDQLKIPEIEAVVGEILTKADSYVHFKSNASKARDISSVTKRASTYWYESIAHQGISAFGASNGYVVYRNVMDYGAKGMFACSALTRHTC